MGQDRKIQHSLIANINKIVQLPPAYTQKTQDYYEKQAQQLYALLLDLPNFTWTITLPSGHPYQMTISRYVNWLTDEQITTLFINGYNPQTINNDRYGTTAFLWWIGNAQFNTALRILSLARKLEDSSCGSYTAHWINHTDEMFRFEVLPHQAHCCCFFQAKTIMDVSNSALILCLAKGYNAFQSAGGQWLTESSFQIAESLLAFPICDINYAEPTLKHTALHIACIHRDPRAIQLLLDNGANPALQNLRGTTPQEMLETSYKMACRLLRFHTSPDHHSKTFLLNKDLFNVSEFSTRNYNRCQELITTFMALRLSP